MDDFAIDHRRHAVTVDQMRTGDVSVASSLSERCGGSGSQSSYFGDGRRSCMSGSSSNRSLSSRDKNDHLVNEFDGHEPNASDESSALTSKDAPEKLSDVMGRVVDKLEMRKRFNIRSSDKSFFAVKPDCKDESGTTNKEHLDDCVKESCSEKFGPGMFEIIRSSRGTMTSLAIKEPNGRFVRLYRRSTTRYKYGYYRCSSCDRLCRKDNIRAPIIKMVGGDIVSETHPAHHTDCKLISIPQLRAMQVDREIRQEIIEKMASPIEAWSKGPGRALLEEAKRQAKVDDDYTRKRVSRASYERHERSKNLTKHHYGRPLNATGRIKCEERMRKLLNVCHQWPRLENTESLADKYHIASSQASTVVDNNEALVPKRRIFKSESLQDDLRSEISELTELPDDDGLLPEDRAFIAKLRVEKSSSTATYEDVSKVSKVSSSCRDKPSRYLCYDETGEPYVAEEVDEADLMKEMRAKDDEISLTPIANRISERNSAESWMGDVVDPEAPSQVDQKVKRPMIHLDKNGCDMIKETTRTSFVVDVDHLLLLFQRCPVCSEKLKTLILAEESSIPVITFKCRGDCGSVVWRGGPGS